MQIYTVKSGDTLYNLARRFGTTYERIARDNDLENPHALTVGQTLVIRQPETVYKVREGDNLYAIARRYGVTINELWRNNPNLGGNAEIEPGMEIVIVSRPPVHDRDIAVNAYVYPFVDEAVLRRTLPYLTYLSIFSYGIEPDGGLVDLEGDEKLIELARHYGVTPVMMITSLSEEGYFSNELAMQVLSNPAAQNVLIDNIADVMAQKGYGAVDVDFEYISGEYADEYAEFLANMRERLEPLGFEVFAALAPKQSADQPGLLYEGHDYRGIGDATDAVQLMTYEWGYTYGPPMAVSPLNEVRGVVDYAVSEIDPEKIMLGVPNYGYDWALPYVRGGEGATPLGNEAALQLAKDVRAAINYDETAQAPFFRYYDIQGEVPVEHIVWFEDARSVQAMLDLVDEAELGGIGVWNAMRYFPQLWLVLNETFNIQKRGR